MSVALGARCLTKTHRGSAPSNEKVFSLSSFFRRFGYPLIEKCCFGADFGTLDEFKKFLSDNLKAGNDLLVCYHRPTLFGQGLLGHASLIIGVGNKYVTMHDPRLPIGGGVRRVLLSRLLDAIGVHGRYRGRVHVISSAN